MVDLAVPDHGALGDQLLAGGDSAVSGDGDGLCAGQIPEPQANPAGREGARKLHGGGEISLSLLISVAWWRLLLPGSHNVTNRQTCKSL